MKVLLTGATGFVGSEILQQLVEAGHVVRVLIRDIRTRIQLKNHLEVFEGNILNPSSLDGCTNGMDAVIHLVGIIVEAGKNTYDRVHRVGTENLLSEAKKTQTKRFIYMSALGTRPGARSQYHQTKWAGEEAIRRSGLDWTIFRPSMIYGPQDQFVNMFVKMTKPPLNILQLFTLPLVGGGYSYMQPIPVEMVAQCFVGALEKKESIGKTYDLCGSQRLRLREIVKIITEVLGYKSKILIPIPMTAAMILAWLMEKLMTKPFLARDQLLMLQEDNVGDPSEAIKDFEISMPDFRSGISAYLH